MILPDDSVIKKQFFSYTHFVAAITTNLFYLRKKILCFVKMSLKFFFDYFTLNLSKVKSFFPSATSLHIEPFDAIVAQN